MNVLSLFDWISCGRLALDRSWIKVSNYFASEIDKYAIEISKKNFPDNIHIWDVKDVFYDESDSCIHFGWKYWYREEMQIDLLIWWSPCQDLSIAKKWWKWLEWEKSSLFYEYLRLLKEVRPKYFLLENVWSMRKQDREKITQEILEIYPDSFCYSLNSSLISAQNRNRLYWTNIVIPNPPEDKWIKLRDILENDVDEKYFISDEVYEKLKSFESNARLADLDWKCWTLSTMQGGHRQPKIDENERCFFEVNECGKLRQWYEYFKEDSQTHALSCSHARNTKVITWKRIRKLTPIECERLQTLPDNYTEWVSNTQRYKAIWNWWTVDMIAFIFSHIKL